MTYPAKNGTALTYLSSPSILLTSLKAPGRSRVSPQAPPRRELGSVWERGCCGSRVHMRVLGWPRLRGLLLALLLLGGCCAGPDDAADAPRESPGKGIQGRWQALETRSARSLTDTHKRHSEGTFTSDFTHYLDKMKAKDFVHWLINTKRYSSTKRDLQDDAHGLPFPGGR